MYAKCGMVAKAREAFEELPKRSVISWNALISGYSQQGLGDEALEVFEQMKHEQFIPNAVTYVCVLDACSSIGYLVMGEEIHLEMLKKGLLHKDITLGNALVDMYGKCGQVERSQQVFDELPEQDVVSWNSLLDGYAQVGQGQKVLYLFYRLVTKGINPDLVTFLIVLHACNHAGLTEEGALMFDKMNFFYGLMPTSKHYACMVDLFSRAGYFNKAIFCINKTPAASRLQAYLALLAGCRKWVNVELGRWAFERAKEIDPRNLTMYICMAELCAATGMQGRFDKNLKP
jgi:pentatricopeptide repeat protein